MTREILDELHRLSDGVNKEADIASELLRTAQDRGNHIKHKLTREGKEVEIAEKNLWDEVWYLGPKCQAGEILEKKYPEVFKAYRKQNSAADELKKFCVVNLGVNFEKLTLSDYLRLSEELFKLLIDEREKKN